MQGSDSYNVKESRKLDSHTNALVVGRFVTILSKTRKTAEIVPFEPEYESLHKALIVGDMM